MAKFIIKKYVLTQTNRAEYKEVKVNNRLWFEANSTDQAIEKLGIMTPGTYIVSIQGENGYNPFFKAIKSQDGIKVLNDSRK